MGMDKEHKKKIISLIAALQPQAKIYLYGSRARDEETFGSDVDLAIDVGEPLDIIQVGEIRDVLGATNIPFQCDIVDLHRVSGSFKEEVLREAIVWKG